MSLTQSMRNQGETKWGLKFMVKIVIKSGSSDEGNLKNSKQFT